MNKIALREHIRGRASSVVFLFDAGLIKEADLPLYCLKARIDKTSLLKAADWLAKNHKIDQNPFSHSLYEGTRLNRAEVHPNIGERWCSPCGKYLGHMHFYIYSGADGEDTRYSTWCKVHIRKKQQEYDQAHKVERANKRRIRRAKQKNNA